MKALRPVSLAAVLYVMMVASVSVCQDQSAAPLPPGVKAAWDMSKAYRETTPTRQRICINGLWRWQPVKVKGDQPPTGNWGYFKVPGPWPKTTWRRSQESQLHYPHPSWKDVDLSTVELAWYQREVDVPKEWAGRRIVLEAQYVNTSGVVYMDGKRAGEIRPRGGKVDLGQLCRPGRKQMLAIIVHRPRGGADFRGLCGDVYLEGVPQGARIDDVKVDTSVRQWQIAADTGVAALNPSQQYTLRGDILDGGKAVKTITSQPFRAAGVQNGRITFSNPWKPDKLWDTNTPQNQYDLSLKLLDTSGKVLDEFRSVRFGFREFWVDGRDFRLNGTRFFCFAAPLDVGEVSAYSASYEGACKMISRFKGAGINIAYTHNYSSIPGAHVSFEEIMRATDDMGMLVSFSQPEFPGYKWGMPDAENTNGYAEDAEIHVRQVQNHPSVVMYTTSHNSTGYAQDQDPDRIDGIYNPFPHPQDKTVRADQRAPQALKAVAIVERFDKTRPIYQHSSGNMGAMYTLNCYLNFVPIQERSDWFGHWATQGIKPLLLVEYGEPYLPTWSNQRGMRATHAVYWYPLEWGAQFRGDAAYQLSEVEKRDFRPRDSENMGGIQAAYIARNWPAFRTWGVSLFNKWEVYNGWNPRPGAANPVCTVDWDNLQKPGFSADFHKEFFENRPRWDISFQDSDWTANRVGEALLRYNRPLLAYIAGKPACFTSRDHNFNPGEMVEKQAIVINNCRQKVACDCAWSLKLPQGIEGAAKVVVETGEQARIPIRLALPRDLKPGGYELVMTAKFDTGETQSDRFTVDVLPEAPKPALAAKLAVFDPDGETERLLSELGVQHSSVGADADLAGYDVFVIGKHALTLTGPRLNLGRVRDGLKVVIFEQTTEVLEKRIGFRTQEYGLRDVFPRVTANAGGLAGLTAANLHDWRGEGTTVPPRLEQSTMADKRNYPQVEWAGFKNTRPWRCGCQGTVATVLIEKPGSGDFLPLVDGGFGLQYAPLMEYREGSGMVLFCQMDVTGRTENDPAATRLVGNLLGYVSSWKPTPRGKLLYAGEAAGKAHLERAGLSPTDYQGGPLTAEQVLVVGPGGEKGLAASAKEVESWLKAGGRLLAVGLDRDLDQDGATALLPLKVATKKAEYVCGSPVGPAAIGSPFAGIAPADLYTREPQTLSLIARGAASVADGVLGIDENTHVVLCQLVPWQIDYQKNNNLKPTFRHASFTLSRLLGNMGVGADTPLLQNLQEPVPTRLVLENMAPVGAERGQPKSAWHRLPDDMVWLEAGENVQFLPQVWKGLPVGFAEPPKDWEIVGYDDRKWRDIKVPGTWEDQFADLVNLDGLFLYRVVIDVPAEMVQRDVTLILGSVDDEDWTYVNGKFVGSITAKTNPRDHFEAIRTYRLPKGLLKPGANTVAVKVNDLRAAGGIRGTMFTRRGAGSTRWLSGLYLDKPEALDDPYRYYRW